MVINVGMCEASINIGIEIAFVLASGEGYSAKAAMTSNAILHPVGKSIVARSPALRFHVDDQNFSG